MASGLTPKRYLQAGACPCAVRIPGRSGEKMQIRRRNRQSQQGCDSLASVGLSAQQHL